MRIAFLTRDGCAGSAERRAHLDEAIEGIDERIAIEVVDVAALAATDYRTGYGTPTILKDDEDLLGAPEPAPTALT